MRWLMALKRRLFPSSTVPDESDANPSPVEYHPAHEGETPDDLHRGRHRLKETFTNHWDLDYLPREDVEAIMKKNRP